MHLLNWVVVQEKHQTRQEFVVLKTYFYEQKSLNSVKCCSNCQS